MLPKTNTRPVVVKYGGSLLQDSKEVNAFLRDVAALHRKTPVVLVHGGGRTINGALEDAGIPPKFHEGRRVTDAATLAVVQRVLQALNADLVRRLCAVGVTARGCEPFHPKGVVLAHRIPELGWVGEPIRARADVLKKMMSPETLPVLCSLGLDEDGQVVNINADEFAACVAMALRAFRLVLVTDTGGVWKGGARLRDLRAADVEAEITNGTITGGMIPKARGAVEALRQGVGEVDICGRIQDLAWKEGRLLAGTRILR